MVAVKQSVARTLLRAPCNPEWIEFVESHPDSTAFHHPAWSAVLAKAYGYEASVLALTSADGQILAGLPIVEVHSRITGSRRVALPFTDHVPALCAPGMAAELGGALCDWASTGARVEVHARLRVEDALLVSSGVRHVLGLNDAATMRSRLSKTPVGRALRKANKTALVTTIERDLGAVRAYYRLHSLTRRRQGVPVQPWRFFRLLHEHLIADGLGMVVLARFRGRPVAGAIFLSWNSTLIYKYGASDPAFLELRPNNVVMWRAIEWGSNNGYHTLDFGKTDTDNIGLRRFKSGWGAQELPLFHTIMPAGENAERSRIAATAATQLIRRSPVVVARAIGELLYGHYA